MDIVERPVVNGVVEQLTMRWAAAGGPGHGFDPLKHRLLVALLVAARVATRVDGRVQGSIAPAPGQPSTTRTYLLSATDIVHAIVPR